MKKELLKTTSNFKETDLDQIYEERTRSMKINSRDEQYPYGLYKHRTLLMREDESAPLIMGQKQSDGNQVVDPNNSLEMWNRNKGRTDVGKIFQTGYIDKGMKQSVYKRDFKDPKIIANRLR